MVTDTPAPGLIASTDSHRTAALDELIACCAWPALLAADAARLNRELGLKNPQWLLLWLENHEQIAPTLKLMTWLRERGPRPYRIAVARRLEHDVEALFRGAGVHFFLPAIGEMRATVDDALWPLVKRKPPQSDPVDAPMGATSARRSPPNLGTFPVLSRPP